MRVLALTDTFTSLPQRTQIIVSVVIVGAIMALAVAIRFNEVTDTRWVIISTVAGFFLVDLFYIHPAVWNNVPALAYWIAKPIVVYIGMFLAAMAIIRYTDVEQMEVFGYSGYVVLLAVAGIAGIVALQLYYTVVPIPIVGGEPIQIGIIGNLTEGLGIHGGGLILAFIVVVAAMRFTD